MKLFCSTEYGKGLLLVQPPAEVVSGYEAGYKAKKNHALLALDGLECEFRATDKCLVADFSGRGHVVAAIQISDRGTEDARKFYNAFPGRRWRVSVTNGKAHRVGLVFMTSAEAASLAAQKAAEQAEAERAAAEQTRAKAEAERAAAEQAKAAEEAAKRAADLKAAQAEAQATTDSRFAAALGISVAEYAALPDKTKRQALHRARLAGAIR